MRNDDFSREILIDYICKISGERVNPLPLFNEKEYRFIDLRGIAFRWFCINHKINLLELMELLRNCRSCRSFDSPWSYEKL